MEKEDASSNPSFDKTGLMFMLESYHDLFSDFDPRHYAVRSISNDFLEEVERAAHRKEDEILDVHLFVPKRMRNKEEERVIETRFHEYFYKHYLHAIHDKKILRNRGLAFVFIGLILMFFAALVISRDGSFEHFFLIILEPSGWFLFWTGLQTILIDSKEIEPKLVLYKKLHKGKVMFYNR